MHFYAHKSVDRFLVGREPCELACPKACGYVRSRSRLFAMDDVLPAMHAVRLSLHDSRAGKAPPTDVGGVSIRRAFVRVPRRLPDR